MDNETVNKVIEDLYDGDYAFQLQSGTEKLRSAEEFFVSGARTTNDIERSSNKVTIAKAHYIAKHVTPECTTIETGGGHSTIVFGALAKKHYCVNPDMTANKLIASYLEQEGLASNIEFVEASSDRGLASLENVSIDFALIDGNHSFPYPIIDWHYIDLLLREGGVVMIDDSQVNAVKLLLQVLDMERAYERNDVIGNCVVYRKVRPTRDIGWAGQAINCGVIDFHLDNKSFWGV